MTLVEFHKNLDQIDFNEGTNTLKLADYLLACLAQLNLSKNQKPSYQLFLSIYDQARNCSKAEFDPSWKEKYPPNFEMAASELTDEQEWEQLIIELRSLIADLIHTEEVQNQPGHLKKEDRYEWITEGGIKFYNGTTPHSILKYAATRFEGEYPTSAFQEQEVTWEEFADPIWIGISYE